MAGILIRPKTCSRCGLTKGIEGHHPNYSKPLDVIWLCCACHRKEHSNMKKEGSKIKRPLNYAYPNIINKGNEMTGENIKAIRQQCGETQERFARRLRVSFVTINRWENNLARPSDLAIRRLNRLFRKLEDSKMENH